MRARRITDIDAVVEHEEKQHMDALFDDGHQARLFWFNHKYITLRPEELIGMTEDEAEPFLHQRTIECDWELEKKAMRGELIA